MLRNEDAVAFADHCLIARSGGHSLAEQAEATGDEQEHESHAEPDPAPKESTTQRGRFVVVEFHDSLVTLEARPCNEAGAFSYVRDRKFKPHGDLEREPKGLANALSTVRHAKYAKCASVPVNG